MILTGMLTEFQSNFFSIWFLFSKTGSSKCKSEVTNAKCWSSGQLTGTLFVPLQHTRSTVLTSDIKDVSYGHPDCNAKQKKQI